MSFSTHNDCKRPSPGALHSTAFTLSLKHVHSTRLAHSDTTRVFTPIIEKVLLCTRNHKDPVSLFPLARATSDPARIINPRTVSHPRDGNHRKRSSKVALSEISARKGRCSFDTAYCYKNRRPLCIVQVALRWSSFGGRSQKAVFCCARNCTGGMQLGEIDKGVEGRERVWLRFTAFVSHAFLNHWLVS